MRTGKTKVILDEKLADWSAAYLAMWKALESFGRPDRCSEPVDFGSRDQRIKVAEAAISRAQKKHEPDGCQVSDIETFHRYLDELKRDGAYGSEQVRFAEYVRKRGSELADQSVVAAQTAES